MYSPQPQSGEVYSGVPGVRMYSGVSVSPGYAGHKRDDAPYDLWLRTADAALTIG